MASHERHKGPLSHATDPPLSKPFPLSIRVISYTPADVSQELMLGVPKTHTNLEHASQLRPLGFGWWMCAQRMRTQSNAGERERAEWLAILISWNHKEEKNKGRLRRLSRAAIHMTGLCRFNVRHFTVVITAVTLTTQQGSAIDQRHCLLPTLLLLLPRLRPSLFSPPPPRHHQYHLHHQQPRCHRHPKPTSYLDRYKRLCREPVFNAASFVFKSTQARS